VTPAGALNAGASVEYRLGELTGEVKGLNKTVTDLTVAVKEACTPNSCPIGVDYAGFRNRIKGALIILGAGFAILTALIVPVLIKVL
jgi:hypothetical protein